MDLKGSKSEKNLEKAFAVESQARNGYIYYAQAARKEGQLDIAQVFLEIAQNEEEHAQGHYELLGRIRDTRKNLEAVARHEGYEKATMYPEFAQTARAEGFEEIAAHFERMGQVEEKHEGICQNLLKNLDEGIGFKIRTVGHSSVTLAQVMQPQQANSAGYVHGGEVMKMMDNASGVVAARHARTNVVTARVDDINFLRPVRVGDFVLAHARVTFVGRSSMEIQVAVENENLRTEQRQQALSAYFTYVALDPSGRPTEVPPLLITTEEGERLFAEGKRRYEERKKLRSR